jgi:protein-S-isoprenylcysteine O-methyltransferase Ste14
VVGSVWIGVLVANSISYGIRSTAIRWQRPLVFGAGLVLMASGYLFRLYAIRVLGRFFTVVVATRRDQRVIEVGPYRYVRHPSYTGSLVTFVGMCLALTNWLALAALLVPIAGYGYRIAVEEAALQEALGDEYRAYMRRTKRLIPYIV